MGRWLNSRHLNYKEHYYHGTQWCKIYVTGSTIFIEIEMTWCSDIFVARACYNQAPSEWKQLATSTSELALLGVVRNKSSCQAHSPWRHNDETLIFGEYVLAWLWYRYILAWYLFYLHGKEKYVANNFARSEKAILVDLNRNGVVVCMVLFLSDN